jgi:hypothetical protein
MRANSVQQEHTTTISATGAGGLSQRPTRSGEIPIASAASPAINAGVGAGGRRTTWATTHSPAAVSTSSQ